MLTSSRYLMNGNPIRCMFCSEAFRPRDGYVEFWRTSTGHHFCSEFCADDAEEAHFRKRPPVAAALVTRPDSRMPPGVRDLRDERRPGCGCLILIVHCNNIMLRRIMERESSKCGRHCPRASVQAQTPFGRKL
jgi:hypothetical protein